MLSRVSSVYHIYCRTIQTNKVRYKRGIPLVVLVENFTFVYISVIYAFLFQLLLKLFNTILTITKFKSDCEESSPYTTVSLVIISATPLPSVIYLDYPWDHCWLLQNKLKNMRFTFIVLKDRVWCQVGCQLLNHLSKYLPLHMSYHD